MGFGRGGECESVGVRGVNVQDVKLKGNGWGDTGIHFEKDTSTQELDFSVATLY